MDRKALRLLIAALVAIIAAPLAAPDVSFAARRDGLSTASPYMPRPRQRSSYARQRNAGPRATSYRPPARQTHPSSYARRRR